MQTKPLSEKDRAFIKAIVDAVKEKGKDFNYYDDKEDVLCIYFEDNGEPSCLIGYGLNAVGYSKYDLESFDGNIHVINGVNHARAGVLLPLLNFHPAVIYAAKIAQSEQDSARTWGKALEVFRKDLTEHNALSDVDLQFVNNLFEDYYKSISSEPGEQLQLF